MRLLFLILLNFILSSCVVAEQILGVGGTFGRSSREPKYTIEFHSEDSPYHPDQEQEMVYMPGKDGKKFVCFLPKVEKAKTEKPASQQNISSMIIGTEKRINLKTPDELLEVLKETCLAHQESWWTYEWCYKKNIRQMRVEGKKAVQEFILGEYDAEATAAFNQNLSDISTLKDPRAKDALQRYHAHQYINGTVCDLTNQPRETEVRFVCAEPRTMITSITELSTCKYAVTIQSPALCRHPLFQEEKPVWHVINCNALSKDYKKDKVEEEEKPEDKQIIMVTEAEKLSADEE